jgi:hypothetical protein
MLQLLLLLLLKELFNDDDDDELDEYCVVGFDPLLELDWRSELK